MWARLVLGIAGLLFAIGCSHPDDAGRVGESRLALNGESSGNNASWIFYPVLQQVHATSFSVIYLAVGGGCNDTTQPCMASAHKLWIRPAGSGSFTVAQTLAPNSGVAGDTNEGFLPSQAHVSENTQDCQKPGSLGLHGTSTTYLDNGPGLGSLENLHPEFNYHYPWKVMTATGLSSNTKYEWYVTIDDDGTNPGLNSYAQSGYYGVAKTALPPAATTPFHFVFSSDQQESTPWDGSPDSDLNGGDAYRDNVMSAIANVSKPDFMISGGDLTLNGGGTKLAHHWFSSSSSDVMSKALATIPFFPAMGNHDWMATGSLDHWDCAVGNSGPPMDRLWNSIPTAAIMYGYAQPPQPPTFTISPTLKTAPYYSFDWGNSHFIILSTGPDRDQNDSTPNIGIDDTQFAWLQNDLAMHQKGNTPNLKHIFVALHDPPFHPYGDSGYPVNYPSSVYNRANPNGAYSPPATFSPNSSSTDQYPTGSYPTQALTDLLELNGVDIVFGGHVHTYSRLQNGGTWYITAGTGGGGLDDPSVQDCGAPGGSPGSVPSNPYLCSGPNVHLASRANNSAIQFSDQWGKGTYNGAARPGYERMFFGYVDVTVNGDDVSVTTQAVLKGYQQPIPNPVTAANLTLVDQFESSLNKPTNVSISVGSLNGDGSGGTVQISYGVNNTSSGTTQLFVSTDQGSTFHLAATQPFTGGAGQYSVSYDMTPGEVIYYYLMNATGSATSAPSSVDTFVFPAGQLLANITFTSSSNALTLHWGNGTGWVCSGMTLQSYNVQRRDRDPVTGAWFWNTLGTTDNKFFVDTGYPCNQEVQYRVEALATTPGGLVVPSLPTPIAETATPSTGCMPFWVAPGRGGSIYQSATLNWRLNAGGYSALTVLRYLDSQCSTGMTATPISTTATSYSDTSITPGVTYCYQIQATNQYGTSYSNAVVVPAFSGDAPVTMQAQPGKDKVFVSWSFAPTAAAAATTIFRTTTPSDPNSWSPVVTMLNPSPNGQTNTWADDKLDPWYDDFDQTTGQLTSSGNQAYYYRAVGHDFVSSVDVNTFAFTSTDVLSLPGPQASASPVSNGGCANGLPDTTFSPGMVACGGSVGYANAGSLCAPGFGLCTAAQWRASYGGKAPVNNYWLADNLGYGYPSGGGSGDCWATDATSGTFTEGNCGSGDPMHICGAGTDQWGNPCNWTGCGFDGSTTNQYFGGCVGNMTAGAMCCQIPSSACMRFTLGDLHPSPQTFAPGVVGCPGKVTWDRRDTLCGPGCRACPASVYKQYNNAGTSGATQPMYDYWTDDQLTYQGSGTNACGADDNGAGYSCGSTNGIPTPMRVCVTGSTTDPLGNVCNWYNCGLDGNSSSSSGNYYFGGCAGDTTAGTLCCCGQ